MEPITHFMTGACLSRTGLNRKTAYATLAMTLAAEAPDIDMLWEVRGPVAAFEHHRGITHTFVGAPFIALLVVAVVWLYHRWRKKKPQQPVRWKLLYAFSLFAALSHLLLDFTNNYGLRPFFPFNPRWYSWDIVFILEPVIFAALLLALVVPALLGLADREISARRSEFHGRGWAIFALSTMVLVWVVRNAEHERALNLVRNGTFADAKILKAAVQPFPLNPFRWFAVVETPDYFQTGLVNTRSGEARANDTLIYKPPVTLATLAAKRSWLGHVYLDWSSFPVVEDMGNEVPPGLDDSPSPQGTTVEFRDLRFAYSAMFLRGNRSPLSAWVVVAPNRTIEATVMDGREQK
ncbi:MAG TPA: metal-dependent hydrolase [Acidisarcina sp.]|nr:metal-dependent hydrolase [Acidisarcina sp.]